MKKQELKKELIKIRNGGFVTPVLERIFQDYHDHEILVKTILETKNKEIEKLKESRQGWLNNKMDEFLKKVPVESVNPGLYLSDFHDYIETGLLPHEIDAEQTKEAKEDYKAGRVKEYKGVSDCCGAPMLIRDDKKINGMYTKKYICDKCKKKCSYQLSED